MKYFLLMSLVLIGCTAELPTGIGQADMEGVWSGDFGEVTLLGRSLSGPIDWSFASKDFEIRFIDPVPDGVELLSGNWKFSKGKLVLTLRSSFPAENDAGATDSLTVSVLDTRLSIHTLGGSNILLRKIRTLGGSNILLRKIWIALHADPDPFRPTTPLFDNRRKRI
jgi:hypothetical protein